MQNKFWQWRGWFGFVFLSVATVAWAQEPVIESSQDMVGRTRDEAIVTPVNQVLTPYGKYVELAGMRPQVVALSPNGKILVVSGKRSELLVVNPETGETLDHVPLPNEGQAEPMPDAPSTNILQPDRSGLV